MFLEGKPLILNDNTKFLCIEASTINAVPREVATILEQALDHNRRKFRVKFSAAKIYIDGHTVVELYLVHYNEGGQIYPNSDRDLIISADGKVTSDPSCKFETSNDMIRLVKPFTDAIQNLEVRMWIQSGIAKEVSFTDWVKKGSHTFRGRIMGKKYGF